MNNTATKESIEENELTPYQAEQPIASLLGDYSRDLIFTTKNERQRKITERMARSAASSIELWSRGISFLIWKASVSDEVCEQTVSSMGSAADVLGCLSALAYPLKELNYPIDDMGVKAESMRVVQSENIQPDSLRDVSREAAIKANDDVHNEMVVMLSELEAIASTSMHRVMGGLENENPVSTDTLIGLFSGITRQTQAIQRASDKIKML